ncbi:MAG: NTP transferase domain-containing protein [Actinobacteria bacterium]|nr:NTP transferase domain-containing protein [Actinomycetota bacterium]
MGLTGLVLAGGASRRMGRDKATLVFEGERLVDRAVRVLLAICGEVLVASGDGRRLDLPVPQVADHVPDAGPLAGLVAGLTVAAHPVVAVVAVDAPFADPGVLLRCVARLGDAPACLPEVDGVPQPLHAAWATAAVADARDALERGERSPQRLAASLGARVLGEPEWRDVARAGGRFAGSWNRPEDVPEPGSSG